jgi:hypothetical protein
VIRRSFRRGLTLGLLGGAVMTALRVVQSRREAPTIPAAPKEWPPLPSATPVVVPEPRPAATEAPQGDEAAPGVAEKPKKPAAAKKKPAPWVEPEDGTCPASHPVKGKLSSKIFHVPTGFNYPRTRPDRCYVDAAAAEADGLRPAKR